MVEGHSTQYLLSPFPSCLVIYDRFGLAEVAKALLIKKKKTSPLNRGQQYE